MIVLNRKRLIKTKEKLEIKYKITFQYYLLKYMIFHLNKVSSENEKNKFILFIINKKKNN
jgi:hypothetical protein